MWVRIRAARPSALVGINSDLHVTSKQETLVGMNSDLHVTRWVAD